MMVYLESKKMSVHYHLVTVDFHITDQQIAIRCTWSALRIATSDNDDKICAVRIIKRREENQICMKNAWFPIICHIFHMIATGCCITLTKKWSSIV